MINISIKDFVKIVSDLGWSVDDDTEPTCIENYSPLGEDLIIEGSDFEDLLINLQCEYENFDVSEHVKMWATSSASGVPQDIVSLYEDAKEIETMINDLWYALTHTETINSKCDIESRDIYLVDDYGKTRVSTNAPKEEIKRAIEHRNYVRENEDSPTSDFEVISEFLENLGYFFSEVVEEEEKYYW